MPVYNEARHIRQSLNAVLAQDYPPELLEILVVDGGSEDETREIVSELLAKVNNGRLLDNPQKIQSAALNVGIQAAQGDIIVRVDGHTVIAPDYITTCVHYLTHDKVANVGGLMRPVSATYVGQAIALATTSPFGIGNSKFHYSERAQLVDTVYMGAFHREVFDRVGLFDEELIRNQDYELNIRIRKAGGKILLSPQIVSCYTPRSSLKALWRQYFQYGRWKVVTLKKHPDSLRWRQIIPPLFVAVLVCSIIVSSVWKPVRWLVVALTSVYLLANSVASTIAARRGGWRYLPVLPVVFASIHLAWGLGFWYGLLRELFALIFKLWKRNCC